MPQVHELAVAGHRDARVGCPVPEQEVELGGRPAEREIGLRFAWPKSERLLYSEPKKLVEHGLATATSEAVGRRSRTVYTITDDGRTALASWMAFAAINAGYLDGEHPFPQRTHLSVLFATFQLELFDLVVRWVDFAKAEIATWPTTEGLGLTDRTEAILCSIKERRSVLESPPPTP